MNLKNTKKMKAKRLSKKFPCSCGHPKSLHVREHYTTAYEWCGGFTPPTKNKYARVYNCDCERFVPDNLKYLEQCANAKKGKGRLK